MVKMAILVYSSKMDHDLIYYIISLDNTEHSFVSSFLDRRNLWERGALDHHRYT
jgi:hypothetical protein